MLEWIQSHSKTRAQSHGRIEAGLHTWKTLPDSDAETLAFFAEQLWPAFKTPEDNQDLLFEFVDSMTMSALWRKA